MRLNDHALNLSDTELEVGVESLEYADQPELVVEADQQIEQDFSQDQSDLQDLSQDQQDFSQEEQTYQEQDISQDALPDSTITYEMVCKFFFSSD